MPCIKNLRTGETHMVTMETWEGLWQKRVLAEPDKYQHVMPETMQLVVEEEKYIEDMFDIPESLASAPVVPSKKAEFVPVPNLSKVKVTLSEPTYSGIPSEFTVHSIGALEVLPPSDPVATETVSANTDPSVPVIKKAGRPAKVK